MKKLDTRKKAYLILSSYLIILLAPKLKNNNSSIKTTYNDKYLITEDYQFATYEGHNIYIIPSGNEYTIANHDDIYIIDSRHDENPNLKICDSSKITNLKDIREVLNILNELEKRYPTEWERTIKSMEIEWLVHNLLYDYQIAHSRTNDVDLDNNDEKKYQSYLTILHELITNINYEIASHKRIKSK